MATSDRTRLAALVTAVPPWELGQPEVAVRARKLFASQGGATVERLLPVFTNSGIDRRYSCVPITWYDQPHGWTDRNELYLEWATKLLEEAARDCLDRAALRPQDIDAVTVVSTTGIATPSLDARLINRLNLREDVRRLPIFGLGCAGGVIGLGRALDLQRAHRGQRALFLVVELCALSFRKDDLSKSNIVATALFGDGALAAILDGERGGPCFGQSGEHTWHDTLDIMGWAVEPDGLRALFSRDIPALVRERMREAAAAFLRGNDMTFADIDHFVCHPGGAKVVTALEEAFDVEPGLMVEAREVLRNFGNMSAVTVWFVLERVLRAGKRGRMLMCALGPGFTAGFQLLEV